MADDVSVQFGGSIDGLKAATKQAADQIEGMVGRVKASMAALQSPFEALGIRPNPAICRDSAGVLV